MGRVFRKAFGILGLGERKGRWAMEKDFHGDFQVNVTWFLPFFLGVLDCGGGQGHGSPGEQGAGGIQEVGSLQWREAGEKFKKASFCYLLLLTSSQRNKPNNIS